MKQPKAFLFDLDGVLLDTEPLNKLAWTETSRSFGAEPSNIQLKSLLGRRKIECANDLIKWSDKKITVDEVLIVYNSIHKKILKDVKAIPWAEELVNFCVGSKIPIALVTSSTRSSATFKSINHKWLELIKIRIYGDDPSLKKGKPNPDPYLLAANKLGINAKSCWALEDSLAGAQSALDAKCKVWILKNIEILDFLENKSDSNPIYVNNLLEIIKELEN
ncbi:HAD family hydrolase [Prochlorococcus marinus]|uniref:HAD family hydrolase n=1 Tax=Prochlorococcus marinus TaxID=1219 RepID=UPI0022B30E0E|nr:HAD family phosphatase [Prochlorococcus marinus]